MTDFTGHNLACLRGNNLLFRDLSFTLASGQVMALTGANGAGKTSLLRMVAGLLSPLAGEMLHDDKIITDNDRAELMHWIGPENPLKPQLTALENLRFWAQMMGAPAARADILAALARMNLESLADTPVQYMSVGQARRTALSRLFLAERPLWLLDEPVNGLDRDTSAALVRLTHEHAAAGGMALVATHRPDFWQPHGALDVTKFKKGAEPLPPHPTPPPQVGGHNFGEAA